MSREAALAWVSLAQRFPASSVLAREGAGCGSVNSAYDFRPPLVQIMSLSYSALPRSQLHLHPGGGGRGPPGCTDIFREPFFLLLRPVPSQVPPKALNAMCTANFPFCSLVGNRPPP